MMTCVICQIRNGERNLSTVNVEFDDAVEASRAARHAVDVAVRSVLHERVRREASVVLAVSGRLHVQHTQFLQTQDSDHCCGVSR